MEFRFFKPSVDKWKYVDTDDEQEITDSDKNRVVKNSFRLVNWNLSFAKNCIQACFIIFLIANIFIMLLLTIDFFTGGILNYFDTYITEVFGLMRDTIGVYIIKSCLENSFKITMSVLSDYIDKKYGTKLDPNSYDDNSSTNTIIVGNSNEDNTNTDEDSYEEQVAADLEGAKIAPEGSDDSSEDGGVYKNESSEEDDSTQE